MTFTQTEFPAVPGELGFAGVWYKYGPKFHAAYVLNLQHIESRPTNPLPQNIQLAACVIDLLAELDARAATTNSKVRDYDFKPSWARIIAHHGT